MRWIDVCGAPGSGKSTLCDHIWHPHSIRWSGEPLPHQWDAWWGVSLELLEALKDHPTYPLLHGMTWRSLRKMQAVYWRRDEAVYIQTGLAQRGLGFGWRLQERGKVALVRRFFAAMPVSLGVAIATCPNEVATVRNRKRTEVAATAHENRAHMVPLMMPVIEILKEEMAARNVAVREIDTTKPIDDARWELLQFASERVAATAAARSGGEVEIVQGDHGPGGRERLPVAHRSSA
jgi:hypothetical protein